MRAIANILRDNALSSSAGREHRSRGAASGRACSLRTQWQANPNIKPRGSVARGDAAKVGGAANMWGFAVRGSDEVVLLQASALATGRQGGQGRHKTRPRRLLLVSALVLLLLLWYILVQDLLHRQVPSGVLDMSHER